MDATTLFLAKRYTDKRIADLSVPRDIYGVAWDKGEDPTLTRIGASAGLVANAGVGNQIVRNDFDNLPIFGEIAQVQDSLGNVFTRIPKFYIRKVDCENYKSWEVSKYKHLGFYLPWCFWDFESGKELPHVDFGSHLATLGAGDKLESKPDKYPLINKTIINFRDYARANGAEYQLLDIHAVDVLQTLMFIEFATLDMQSVMRGYTTGQYTATHLATVTETSTNRIVVANAHATLYRVGQTISVGTTQGGNQRFYGRTIVAIEDYDASNKAIVFDGDPVNITAGDILYNTAWKSGFSSGIAASSGSIVANDGKYPCVYRGIESPHGDAYQFVDGVNIDTYQAWVRKDARDYASNVFAHPYEMLGYMNSSADGYVKEMGYDPLLPFAELPTVSGGGANAAKYYCDYYYKTAEAGARIARFGGRWDGGAAAGPSLWALYSASGDASVICGGRLLKKPL